MTDFNSAPATGDETRGTSADTHFGYRTVPLAEKQARVIGLAVIDHKLCLPWAKGEECLVCEELCPIPQKAVVFGTEGMGGGGHGNGSGPGQGGSSGETGGGEAALAEGASTEGAATGAAADVKLPRILERHCTGCGICQYNCPVQDPAPAIVVKRLAETTPPSTAS